VRKLNHAPLLPKLQIRLNRHEYQYFLSINCTSPEPHICAFIESVAGRGQPVFA
jgi:hypothetical protein